MRVTKVALLAGCSLTLLAPMAQAHAASTQDPQGSPQVSTTLDEIIVTAQRRSESAARTPVAVAVLSSEALSDAAITSQSDLRVAVPGLQVRASTSSNDLNYAIRGQSLDAYSNGLPGVLPYFNEVQIGGAGASSAFYDLANVQALKGPQGTLFGKNATGGAVLFTSAKPSDVFEGYGSVSAGSRDAYKVEGAVSGPLVNGVAARLAGFVSAEDGYQHNIYDNEQLGDSERYGLRGSLSIEKGRFKNDFVADYYNAEGTNIVGILSSLSDVDGFPATSLYSDARFPEGSGPLTGTHVSDFVLSQILQAQGLPADVAAALTAGAYDRFIAGFNGNPGAPRGGLAQALAEQQARGPYRVASDLPNNFNTENLIFTNATGFALGDELQLKNILGYTDLSSFNNSDADGTGFGISGGPRDPSKGILVETQQFSEELQLMGKAFDGRLDFVTGVYYSKEETQTRQSSFFFDIMLGGAQQQNDTDRTNTSYAAYAQGTYDLSETTGIPGLSATLGLRYTNEEVRNQVLPSSSVYGLALVDPGNYDNDQTAKFDNVGWTIGLKQQVNSNLLIYATSRRSYKNGGFNGLQAPKIGYADVAGNAYRTEELTDLEIGSKFQGHMNGVPVRLNAAAYYDWIKDSQRTGFATINGSPGASTINVPEARVYGLEVDGQIMPTDWLTLGGSINLTNAEFTEQETFINGVAQLAGTYPDVPEFSGTLFADVTVPLNSNWEVLLHGDVYSQTETYFSSTANTNPQAINDGYTLLNLRAGLRSLDNGWTLMANVKNVLDEEYYVGGLPLADLVQVNTRIPGAPRTWTIELRRSF